MAGPCGARGTLSPHSLLFDLPPALLGELCTILDSCDGPLGWRGLAERLSNSWLDVRHIEKYVHQGKSGTRELLWSWAQKNKTIGDLLQVLHEMGHQRAIHLIMNYGVNWTPPVQTHHELRFPNLPPNSKPVCRESDPGPLELANVTVDNVLVPEHNERGVVLHKTPISFQSILEGTKHFHKDFLIGEGEIFEVYRVEIRNQTYAVKLFKQVQSPPHTRAGCIFHRDGETLSGLSLYEQWDTFRQITVHKWHNPTFLARSNQCVDRNSQSHPVLAQHPAVCRHLWQHFQICKCRCKKYLELLPPCCLKSSRNITLSAPAPTRYRESTENWAKACGMKEAHTHRLFVSSQKRKRASGFFIDQTIYPKNTT
ncbi:interleukin-1 receptor-associated kinase 3 isoform X5 [Rattus norvegicus]|uniref:interleukin-1 receptor-associated kinase 3 isoform X5 n=1 Tax=Rattus norvegicus TaxID=10116 RepID=UPI002FD82EA5